jgi:hypothetical protein
MYVVESRSRKIEIKWNLNSHLVESRSHLEDYSSHIAVIL